MEVLCGMKFDDSDNAMELKDTPAFPRLETLNILFFGLDEQSNTVKAAVIVTTSRLVISLLFTVPLQSLALPLALY